MCGHSQSHKEIIDLLISSGAKIDSCHVEGYTPLHWAALRGRVDMAELLITMGAEPNAKSNQGWTPLHRALGSGPVRYEMLQFFLSKGADINMKADNGWTILKMAKAMGLSFSIPFPGLSQCTRARRVLILPVSVKRLSRRAR
ncbi:MAG: ankyrin repeat domain-containing protein [Candidatus Eremiobacteraeota bacterium]|nr:ankyrin repeat domain-containing protein [Candidatus Eremiobacteraeota bacterium]